MKIQHTIETALGGLKANRTRSALTILGIVIGITAIMVVMSVGSGAESLILNQIQGLGADAVFVEPGREPKGPSDFSEAFTDSIKDREVEALRRLQNQGVDDLSPMVMLAETAQFERETKRGNILGIGPLLFDSLKLSPDEGVFFTDDDVRQRSSLAVIGSDVKEELFGLSDAVGKRIKIKNTSYRVVGVIAPKGQVSFFDIDNSIFVPYTSAQDYLTGTNHYQAVWVKAESEADVDRLVNEITLTLRTLHGITDPDKDDFHVTTQAEALERVGVITTVLQVLLISIAAISLIVGGIGIMNIMLVSVTERTREVGLRKALGARDRDILRQFLFEAILLTMMGGLIGIALGAALSFLASYILTYTVALSWQFTFPVSAMLLGLGVSGGIGLIFGLYPASKAARKSPMEALRYE